MSTMAPAPSAASTGRDGGGDGTTTAATGSIGGPRRRRRQINRSSCDGKDDVGDRRSRAGKGGNGGNDGNDGRKKGGRDKDGRRRPCDGGRRGRRPPSSSSSGRRNEGGFVPHETHASLSSCMSRYSSCDPYLIRGKLRVLSSGGGGGGGGGGGDDDGISFVTCDRGHSTTIDVLIRDGRDRNRALDGDWVYVELRPEEDDEDDEEETTTKRTTTTTADDVVVVSDLVSDLTLGDGEGGGNAIDSNAERGVETRRDDDDDDDDDEAQQRRLWNPAVDNAASAAIIRGRRRGSDDVVGGEGGTADGQSSSSGGGASTTTTRTTRRRRQRQRSGRVVHVVPPRSGRTAIVGTILRLPGGGNGGNGRYMLVPNNKSLPRFVCPSGTTTTAGAGGRGATRALYRAEYVHGTWLETMRWPPCVGVARLTSDDGGRSSSRTTVLDETSALLVENGVDHGDFGPDAMRDVEMSVVSGQYLDGTTGEIGWRPSGNDLVGRRDYRDRRVFTIDPSTARDLDDALHVSPLPDGRVEVGVHIADVSHFLDPGSAVDEEAMRRATTVYLVNDVIPMLPRPLCEVACSLNENVERLAFSCVWKMNMDGTLSGGSGNGRPGGGKEDVWYGRTIIKSCARLDYATAQNIIDGKVANGEGHVDETLWPSDRRPTGGHGIDRVASDVRLMHTVAMARRRLRFENGALALNGIKLAFQLEEDGETTRLCAPYPIRDSNRLVEEFMLLANYLVAQRLITKATGRALLRHHPSPLEGGMQQVVDVSREAFGFDIDTTNSKTLQESLSRLSRECDDELVVQCVTESLKNPMKPASYIAAGEVDDVEWRHFALNIPYYTHFTSPIRRYPDVIVHRLLQATLDDAVDDFPMTQQEIQAVACHCNDMRMAAKKAQERSDRVFLALHLKRYPISSALGVCLGVGEKTFTVFVPSLGMSTRVFLQEHDDEFDSNAFVDSGGKRRIVIQPKTDVGADPSATDDRSRSRSWKSLEIDVFTKLEVACTCKMQSPIDVRVKVVGPWVPGSY